MLWLCYCLCLCVFSGVAPLAVFAHFVCEQQQRVHWCSRSVCVPRPSQCVQVRASETAGALALLAVHTTGWVRELRWAPLILPDTGGAGRLGVLAAVHGDGIVRIYSVPALAPAVLAPLDATGAGFGVCHMTPWAIAAVSGVKLTCVAWCPDDPCLFLTGLADGTPSCVCVYSL